MSPVMGQSLRDRIPGLVPSFLLFASLELLRWQLVRDLGLDFTQAWQARIYVGWAYDVAAVATVAVASLVLGLVLPIAHPWRWVPLALALWIVNLANLLFCRFFGVELNLWVIKLHLRDMFLVGGSAADLGSTWLIIGSAVLMPLSLGASIVLLRRSLGHGIAALYVAARQRSPALARHLGAVVVVVLTAFVGWRLPQWIDPHQGPMLVSNQVIRLWWYELTRKKLHQGVSTQWMSRVVSAGSTHDASAAGRTLAAYRDFRDPSAASALVSEPDDREPGPDPHYPLVRPFVPAAETTRALRAQLGLPNEGPIHIVVIFVESFRAFEFEHPLLGPEVFPRLRKLLGEHAIHFTQAYSSAFSAGETVRGQFSTLCSMLPNIAGAAPYLAHTGVRVRCLTDLLSENGYLLTWFNSFKSTFHNARQFELLHGTKLFFDRDYFRGRGVYEQIGDWGLADAPFLQETLRTLEEQAAAHPGQPLFANVLTMSTHHPFGPVPGGTELSASVLDATAADPSYRGYLARFRYADEALGEFFAELFRGPLGGNTVVVLQADHSIGSVRPTFPMTAVQQVEAGFRIPIGIITRDLPNPARVERPVHQLDIAPTLARIAGARGDVTWLGRGLLAQEGSPWLYATGDQISYRTSARGCYQLVGAAGRTCFDLTRQDPLFAAELAVIPEKPEQTALFRQVVEANLDALAGNTIAPVRGSAALR